MTKPEQIQNLKNSIKALQACQKLIETGYQPGIRAERVHACLTYLNALESQCKADLNRIKQSSDEEVTEDVSSDTQEA